MRLPAAPTGNKKHTGSENNVLGLVESKFLRDALMVHGINLCVCACVSVPSHHGEDTGRDIQLQLYCLCPSTKTNPI